MDLSFSFCRFFTKAAKRLRLAVLSNDLGILVEPQQSAKLSSLPVAQSWHSCHLVLAIVGRVEVHKHVQRIKEEPVMRAPAGQWVCQIRADKRVLRPIGMDRAVITLRVGGRGQENGLASQLVQGRFALTVGAVQETFAPRTKWTLVHSCPIFISDSANRALTSILASVCECGRCAGAGSRSIETVQVNVPQCRRASRLG